MSGPLRSNPVGAMAFATASGKPEADGLNVWMIALRMYRRRIWLMLGIVLAVCLAALPLIMSMEKRYFAEARIILTPAPALRLLTEDAQTGLAPDMAAQTDQLSADQVIRQVIDELQIADLPEFNGSEQGPSLSDRVKGVLAPVLKLLPSDGAGDQAEAIASAPEDDVLRSFRARLSLRSEYGTNAISVGFSSRDPALAERVPMTLVDTYLAQATQRWKDEIDHIGTWMRANIDKDQARLAESRAALDQFVTQSGLGNAGDSLLTKRMALLEERQSELARERFQTTADQRAAEAAQENPDLPLSGETPTLQRLRSDLTQERRELTKARATYGQASPQVQQRADRITALKETITTELASWLQVLDQRADAQASEAAELESELARMRAAMATSRSAEPVAKSLRETVMLQEEALNRQETTYQKLQGQAQIAPVQLNLLVPATLQPAPLGPGRKAYMMAALAGGMLLSLIVAAILELRDNTLRSHDQLAHIDRLVPVGMMPKLSQSERRNMAPTLLRQGSGAGADAIRDTILLLECANRDHFPKCLTVTAPEARDQMEPIAEWLALELALQGRRVRLVDARQVELGSEESNREDARTAPQKVLKLKALPCDRPEGDRRAQLPMTLTPLTLFNEPAPERLVLSELARRQGCDPITMLRRLGQQAQQDDIITIIDGPPLMNGAGLRLARDGGQVLLVLSWGQTKRAAVELLVALLGRVGLRQVHSMIVGIDLRRHRQYGFDDRLSLARNPLQDIHR